VKVLSADAKTRRIALSIKALQGPSQRLQHAQQQKAAPTLNEKLNMLATKWKVS
jgi:uncharacterized protein